MFPGAWKRRYARDLVGWGVGGIGGVVGSDVVGVVGVVGVVAFKLITD